jgi:spore germination cell wall hydrolase CwlJ-like protein
VSAYPASPRRLWPGLLALACVSLVLSGCGISSKIAGVGMSSRECLARAMYFESNRNSDDGMLGVGTVVMNRYESGKYGKTICQVVGAPRQFAPGVLTRSMTEPKSKARAFKVAGEVLGGKRHPVVGKAEFFHTAGYKPGYNNMRYVSIEGGNAFYVKVKKGEDTGDMVRLARNGPSNIDDLIVINSRTVQGQKPIPDLPPMDQPVYAPPAPQRQPELGWQTGPSGRLY